MLSHSKIFPALLLLALAPAARGQTGGQAGGQSPTAAASSQPQPAEGMLSKDDAGKLMPPTVFFRGQNAPVQARNAAGIRFPGGRLLLTALVDSSGYSSTVQQRYQAYLITEVPLSIEGHDLAPGAYGYGFIADNRVVIMDLGDHQLFTVASTRDAAIRRPTPLQIDNVPNSPQMRLYEGRSYVTFTANLSAAESRP